MEVCQKLENSDYEQAISDYNHWSSIPTQKMLSELFRPGEPAKMSKEPTSNKSQTDWQRLQNMTDEEIDFSDCPEATPEMFARAIVRQGLPEKKNKVQVTLRIDDEVLTWFKAQGQGYQTQINNLLRAYMEASTSD